MENTRQKKKKLEHTKETKRNKKRRQYSVTRPSRFVARHSYPSSSSPPACFDRKPHIARSAHTQTNTIHRRIERTHRAGGGGWQQRQNAPPPRSSSSAPPMRTPPSKTSAKGRRREGKKNVFTIGARGGRRRGNIDLLLAQVLRAQAQGQKARVVMELTDLIDSCGDGRKRLARRHRQQKPAHTHRATYDSYSWPMIRTSENPSGRPIDKLIAQP